MAVVNLSHAQDRTEFFYETVLLNLNYWLARVEALPEANIGALRSDRDTIVRSITFALELGQPAWPETQRLITGFALFMERRGQWDTWSRVLEHALEVARPLRDKPNLAKLSALLGRVLFWRGHFKESVAHYRQAIRLAREGRVPFIEAQACSNLGYYYIEQGYWQRAELLCCRALQLFEQIGSDHGQAHTHNHLGILATWQGLWPVAQHHLECACAIWQMMGDAYGLMNGYNNLGRLCNERGQPDQALIHLENAVEWARQAAVEPPIASLYINMSIAYRQKGALDRAEQYCRQAEALCRRYTNLKELARVQDNLGLIYVAQQQWPAALACFENALTIWRSFGNAFNQAQTLVFLADCARRSGQAQRAQLWLAQAEALLETLGQAEPYATLRARIKAFATT